MYKIKIELHSKESEIVHIQRPEIVELIFIKDEFLNANGHISEILVSFIFSSITSGFFNKLGEDVYNYLKKIISKNNEFKDKSILKFQITSKDFTAIFYGNNLNSKNIEKALKEFGKIIDNISEMKLLNINNISLVFDEKTEKCKIKPTNNQKSFEDIQKEAMEKFND